MASQVAQLEETLRTGARWDGRRFSDSEVKLLTQFYELALKWNNRLHLTTLTQPQTFFERHILESAFAESLILPCVNQVWDLGSGLGIPGLVIAVLRPDLSVHLVEASRNKAVYLEVAVETLQLTSVKVVRSRFEIIEGLPAESCLTVRAIEGMEKMLPEILRLGMAAAQCLVFGGKPLEAEIMRLLTDQRQLKGFLMPGSDHRYLLNIFRST